jgi:hypothetical protein
LLDPPPEDDTGYTGAERRERHPAVAQHRQRERQQEQRPEARAERERAAQRPEADRHDREERQPPRPRGRARNLLFHGFRPDRERSRRVGASRGSPRSAEYGYDAALP